MAAEPLVIPRKERSAHDRIVTLTVVSGLSAATLVMGFVAIGNLSALMAFF